MKFLLLVYPFFLATVVHAQSVSLSEAIRSAEETNPRLKGAGFRAKALDESITAQKARYLPELDLAAIASTGSAGSFSLLDVDSGFSAADRIGEGAGLVLKQDLWDFGRTSGAVQTARVEADLETKRAGLARMEIDEEVLKTYVNCAYLKSEVENTRFTAEQARLIARETSSFVRSGQRSVVEKYLVDAQAEEANTRMQEFSERVKVTEQRLAVEIGKPAGTTIDCEDLVAIDRELSAIETTSGLNPVIEVQTVRVRLAQARIDEAKAQARPKLIGAVTGGYFDNNLLATKMNYAAGIGITFPLFSGFKLDADIDREIANLSAEQAGLDEANLSVKNTDSRFDEQIRSLTVRLNFLKNEDSLGHKVLDLARHRYHALQGTMVDLRESIRNMSRVQDSTSEAQRDLFIARGQKTLLNGSRPPG